MGTTKKRIITAITALVLVVALAVPFLTVTPALADTSGPNYASGAADGGGGGVSSWTTPAGCLSADDSSYATTSIPNSGNHRSNYLYATDFGFTIPAGATIDGIEVRIMRQSSSAMGGRSINDEVLRLLKAGALVGNDYGTSTDWPTSMGWADYGTTSDLWGATWTPAEINATTFGVALQTFNQSTHSTKTASVDYIRVTVTYTAAAVPGITVDPTSGLVTAEDLSTDTFDVVLDTLPTHDVTVGISSDNTDEGTVLPTSLTFGSGNGTTPQTVTVTGVDDDVDDGDQGYNIVTAAAVSGDTDYSGEPVDDVSVTNEDDDTAGVTIVETSGSTDVDEEGPTSDTYSVELDSEPTAYVDISITPDAQVTVDPTALTFGSGNWSTPQDVTVTAVDDADIECPHTGTITHSASSGDAKYNGISIDDVIANIADNDGADLAVQMAMILDGSGSISSGEWDTMLDGLAAAVQNVTCVPHDCSVELTVIQFSDDAHLEVGPVVISESNVADVAAEILDLKDEQMEGSTCIACGICLAANVLHDHPDSHFSADIKQALNLVTDGEPNRCCNCTTDCTGWECTGSGSCNATASAEAARTYALNLLAMTDDQDEFDAEFIGTQGTASNWLKDEIVWPEQPGGDGYYAPPFDKGPGWVRVVANADEFAETICEKFALIVQPCSITIEKQTDPDGSLQSFNFTGTQGSFNLSDGDSEPFTDLLPSTYNFTEDVPGGWTLTSVNCTGGSCTNITDGVSIDLGVAENVTCTFTNTKLEPLMTIDMDVDPHDVVPGGQVEYTIEVINHGSTNATNVSIWAMLPAGFTYDSTGTIVEVNASRSSTDPSYGDTAPGWGEWLIESGGRVTIPFTVDVGISVGTGTYDSTAYANGDNFAQIDDEGEAGQDGDTPPGEDPEIDEDVTIRGGLSPVGGEAYPVNKLAILLPWIALAALLAGGVGWFALRRRGARG